MKRTLILFIAMLAVQLAFGQLSLGPKIGYTASNLSTDKEDIKDDMKSSLHFGAFARMGTKVYFQPELLWMTKGTEFKYQPSITGNSELKQDVKLKTIDVPLLVGVKLVDLKITNIRAMAGPVASFVMDKEVDAIDLGQDVKAFEKDNLKEANWGIQIGAGVDVLKFSLDVRYEMGLNNMYDGETDLNIDDLKNNAFLVSLGWAIF